MAIKNPYRSDPRYRLEMAFDLVGNATRVLLDYGCSDGRFLFDIQKKIPKAKLIGLEVDKEKITLARRRFSKGNFLSSLKSIRSGAVDTVTLLDVLEHVPSEKGTLNEISRILKPGGTLLLSTPHKGLTEVFDPGNIKFRFPKVHKYLYEKVFKQKGYSEKFEKGNLIGDVTRQDVLWHRHYSLNELNKLLKKDFKIVKVYYYGLFFPILSMIHQAFVWIFKKDSKILKKFVLLDSRTDFGKLSFSIFIDAIKK